MKKRGQSIPGGKLITAPASVFRRMLAFLIDILIVELVLVMPFKSIIDKVLPSTTDYAVAMEMIQSSAAKFNILVSVMIMVSILMILYFSILEYKIGQTIGKIIMNIHVEPEKKSFKFWQVLVSNLTFIPIFPFILLWIIDPIYMLISQKNQRLMEKISKVIVTQKTIVYGV